MASSAAGSASSALAEGVMVGGRRVHPSHRVQWLDGLGSWLCVMCGGRGAVKISKLARPCSGRSAQ
eukprot:1283994-Alexandrium_andersonii.AAC.1